MISLVCSDVNTIYHRDAIIMIIQCLWLAMRERVIHVDARTQIQFMKTHETRCTVYSICILKSRFNKKYRQFK